MDDNSLAKMRRVLKKAETLKGEINGYKKRLTALENLDAMSLRLGIEGRNISPLNTLRGIEEQTKQAIVDLLKMKIEQLEISYARLTHDEDDDQKVKAPVNQEPPVVFNTGQNDPLNSDEI